MKKYSLIGKIFASLPYIKNMNNKLVVCEYKQ